jgi:hypothetical protein
MSFVCQEGEPTKTSASKLLSSRSQQKIYETTKLGQDLNSVASCQLPRQAIVKGQDGI